MNLRTNSTSLLLASTCCISATAATKPNLLIIHTDEHNFRTLSCYQDQLSHDQAFVWGDGVNIKTPNIDRIANEGAICNRYYCAAAVSTPSRASLITGIYSHKTGAAFNGQHIRQDLPTFASILSDNGYSTSYVGKWHLAGDETQYKFNIKYKAGFDDNRYMMNGGHQPYFRYDKNGLPVVAEDWRYVNSNMVYHYTDYFTDRTIELIERDKEKPFCIMVSIPDPHTPDMAKPPYDVMYAHLLPDFVMPETSSKENLKNRPKWRSYSDASEMGETTPTSPKRLGDNGDIVQYFGQVRHIDDSVGRMLDALEESGILDNTIVIFTSDHGDLMYEHGRFNKGLPYDASAKIPFVIRYPEKISAGKVVNAAYVNTDFAPTILSLMDVDYSGVQFDGEDTSEDFTNDKKCVETDRLAFAEMTGGSWAMLSNNRYKLVLSPNTEPWLFDLKKDPNELINFYSDPKYRKIVEEYQPELLARLKKFESLYINRYILEAAGE